MSYEIFYYGNAANGNVNVQVGGSNVVGGMTFIGRNYSENATSGFGRVINQNYMSLQENFGANIDEIKAGTMTLIPGQLWYDPTVNGATPGNFNLNLCLAGNVQVGLLSNISVISRIANGASNVSIPVASGNVAISVNGTPNVVTVGSTGSNVNGTLGVTGTATVNSLSSNGTVTGTQLISTVTTGTSPLVVTSTTQVANLNASSLQSLVPTTAPTLSTIVVRDGTSGANFSGGTVTASFFRGDGYQISNISAATAATATTAGTVTTNAQPNITSVGTLISLAVSGDITANNATLSGNLSANVGTFNTLFVNNNLAANGVVNFTNASNVSIGSAAVLRIPGGTAGSVLTTDGASNLSWSNPTTSNISSNNITVNGALTVRNITTGSNVTTGTITGAWSLTAGSKLEATYADLAEYYEIERSSSVPGGPGTVVEFGGSAEIRVCDTDMSTRIAGVISTEPAYVMNVIDDGKLKEPVALQGRVPCKVIGKTRKGDMMVSAGSGYARAEENPKIGSVIGKALENKDNEELGIIEVAVGRL